MAIPNQEIGQFKPGKSGNLSGRPKKIYTILKESGYSKDDMRNAFNEISWADPTEIQHIIDSETHPAIVKVVAKAFQKAMEKGDYRYCSEIIQQVIGQPKESVDVKQQTAVFHVRFNEDSNTTEDESK
jgi:Family of unknown function (DUF5681)